MKPAYSSDFAKGSLFPGGRRQKAARNFILWGIPCLIPAVYRFPEGIVFDLFSFPAVEKLRDFYETYSPIEDTLSPAVLRKLEGEHPCPLPSPRKFSINGLPASEWDSQGFLHMSWAPEKNSPVRLLQKRYGKFLQDAPCFSCQRFRVPFPQALQKTGLRGKLFPSRISSLSITYDAREGFFPLELEIPLEGPSGTKNRAELSFQHPETGVVHTLWLQGASPEKLPREEALWVSSVQYETSPPLREGETLCFDSSISISRKGEGFSPDAAEHASIGIIGGADGSTALFHALETESSAPVGPHGLPVHYTFTMPARRPEDADCCFLSGIAFQKEAEKTVIFSF